MGTTRIKVIDLSSSQQEIKTSRKHAEKLTAPAKIKTSAEPKEEKIATTEETEVKTESTEKEAESAVKSTAPDRAKTTPTAVARKHRHLGKKYQQAVSKIDKTKNYPLSEALSLLSETSFTKFDPTVEAHINVVDKNIRGTVNFPHPIGTKKEKKILVFGNQQSTISDLTLGRPPAGQGKRDPQLIWGDEKTIEEIAAGRLKPNKDFDQVYSTPKFMPLLVKIAKILGPAGLMPNPKNGTIIEEDPQKFLENVTKNSQDQGFEYKTDPTAPIIHTKIGKLSLKPQQLEENLRSLILGIGPTKIKKATISSTMGPGIKVDFSSIN